MQPSVLSEDAAELFSIYDAVDVVIGIPSFKNAKTIGHVVRAVEAGLRKYFPDHRCMIVISDGNSPDGTQSVAVEANVEGDEDSLLIDPKSEPPSKVAFSYSGPSGKGSAFRAIFTVAASLRAKACAVFDADLRSISPEWVDRLVSPVLLHGYDHVTPVYARHKFDGTITNSVAFPITTALYGHKVRQPIGGEFGFSGRLAGHWAEKQVWETDVARFGVDIWMTTVALCEGFRVCQAQLGAKLHDPKDPGADLGPMFRQVVGSLFALAGRYVDRWQETDHIRSVPIFGFRTSTTAEAVVVNHNRLLWDFVEGYVTYQKIWRQVLAAENLAGVMDSIHAASERPEGFVLPVELWACICYDYLVSYNTQAIDPGKLMDSMIPLYFARTATYLNEVRDDTPERAERRIEHYADVFAQLKPYLVRRFAEGGRARRLHDQRVEGQDWSRGDDTGEFRAVGR
ncbi:MAG TPA: glycosyl transferase family 2 [Actinomycetes bacterium]|nr:glycosyl transferase family 2 [Actinomycetes bacterium]